MLRNLDIFILETLSHMTRRVALANGGEAMPYSDLSVGRIEGLQRTIPALVADGITDGDNWYVVNLIDNTNNMSRYVQSVAVLGATSQEQAREWALKNIGAFIGANDAWNTAYTSTKVLKTFLNRPSTSVAMIAIRQADLDTIARQITDKPVVWDGSRLVSHDAASLLHELVKHDDEVMMMDAMTPADLPILMVEMGGEVAEYDALIVDYNRLDLLMQRLNAAMQKSSVGNVKPVNVTQSKPFKRNSVTNVAALFEMSDGQSVTIVFHSPDNTPAKLSPSDTLTSWKWMLNKRDISAAVSPKNGENVQMPDLAKRILTIVEKNSARFIRANGNKAAQIQELTDTNTRIGQKQEALAGILAVNKDLQKQIDEAGKLTAPVVAKQEPKTDSNGRPENWRTTLTYARTVANSLGIETKGKKLDRLVKDIDIFDENEMKKQVLVELKALASRLALPTGYVLDLKEVEKSIDNAWMRPSAWINKQGNKDKNDITYVELRVNPYPERPYFNYIVFAGNRDNSKIGDKLGSGAQSADTAKQVVEAMEAHLIKVIFPAIEYQKVLNSTDIDVVNLPSLGVATITNVGSENINIEKDGKFYISKVGNTENYALGEWDFAQYPEGKPATAAPVTQPEQAPVVPEPTPDVTQAEQPASEPPMTNPDQDTNGEKLITDFDNDFLFLQMIVNGTTDALTADMDSIIAMAEKYDSDAKMMALIDQALEVINQAEQEAAKGI